MKINNNDSLTFCDIEVICDHLDNGGPFTINNNDIGCNDVTQIQDECALSKRYFIDLDKDGYGDLQMSVDTIGGLIKDYVLDSTDCDGNNSMINPGADEICNDGIDNDCDMVIDNVTTNTWGGPDTGYWNDDAANWSQNRIPTICDQVVIPSGKHVLIHPCGVARAYSLSSQSTGQLTIGHGGELKLTHE